MFLLYFLLWIIFNGAITVEICIFGLAIASAMFWFTCKFMDYSMELELANIQKIPKFFRYMTVLVIEIVKANLAVMHMILNEEEEIEPTLITFDAEMKTATGKAFLSNAITLTPGTITVSQDGDEYMVHCLDQSLAEGIDDSVFTEMLQELEKGE